MKTIAAIFSLAFVIILTGCNAPSYVYRAPRYGYTASTHNVPVFTKQFDSKIAANYSTDGGSADYRGVDSSELEESKTQGLDLQTAFAITKHIAIQANYFHRKEDAIANSETNFADSRIKYERDLLEFGAGYFGPVDEKKHLFFQLYAGAGIGKTTIRESGTDISNLPYNRSYNADILKFYLEPSLTFRTRIAFAGTLFTKASIIKFSDISTNYSNNEKIAFKLDSLDRYSALFFEHGGIASLGFRKLPGIRIEVQASISILYGHSFIGYRPFNFAIGLVFDLPKLIKWQKYVPYEW